MRKSMILNNINEGNDESSFRPDSLDLKMMQLLAEDGGLSYKQLADKLRVDKRTVAKHLEDLKRNGVLKITVDINWPLIGVGAFAFVGTQTALGDEDVAKLYEYIRLEPRVIEAYSTLGSDEYFLTVLDKDLQTLREEVLRHLEPLTADLSTAIVSRRIKAKNHAAFLSFLIERDEKLRSKSAARGAKT